MSKKHTVEKIGGTSMSRFGEVMKNVIIGSRELKDCYNRVFIVSAYGGITNLLLENKKTAEPGVYGKFANGDDWESALEELRTEMLRCNRTFADIGLDIEQADDFINTRLDGVKTCLKDLVHLRSFGHFTPKEYLPATREFLSAIGEAHSAFNSTLILKANGINARFIDLTGWKDANTTSLNEAILKGFKGVDFSKELCIVTGYVKYDEGIMTHFDRGYSEITFSKTAVLTEAFEGIIHKEFHLCTADPNLVGIENVEIIGNTNFDIADQLADMDMEAIHSKASKDMELHKIPIRIKNAFEPEHPGTLISHDYVSPTPRVEMICGRSDIVSIEVHDPEMVGEVGYDYELMKCFKASNISYIAKNTNANTITHCVSTKSKNIEQCIAAIQERFPASTVTQKEVAIISVIGSNMKIHGFLLRAAKAFANAGINILALDQSMRQVNMQFIIEKEYFEQAQCALHKEFVQK
jgi:aspartate kinase